MAALPAVLLAHQGGWDEFLLVATPIALIVGALMLVKRRVDAAADHAEAGQPDDPGSGAPSSGEDVGTSSRPADEPDDGQIKQR